jgi:phage gp46-like protein
MPKLPGGNYLPDFSETYVVGAAVAESHQLVNVFLPDPADFPMPPGGYPALVGSTAGGFVNTPPAPFIPLTDPPILSYRALNEQGIAVIGVGFTGTFLDQIGTLNTTSIGRGIFHPPGTAGWLDETRYSAQKEAVLAVQLIRENASAWGIDPDRLVVEGGSSSGCAFMSPAFWPDQADPTKTDHRRQSSSVRGMRLRIPQTDWKLYDPAEPAPANFNCFPSAAGDISTDLCTTFGDAPSSPVDYLRWGSGFRMALDTALGRNRISDGFSIWVHSHEGGLNVTDLSLDGEWAATTGKQSVQLGTVDPVTTEARHEAAHALLLIKGLRETEVKLNHTRTSRLVVDSATYDYAIATDPGMLDLINHIQDYDQFDQELVDLELAWLAMILLDPTPPPEIRSLPKIGNGRTIDVAFVGSPHGLDLDLFQGDLGRDQSFRAAIVASLFSDARAPKDTSPLPDGSTDPRGWWGEESRGAFGSLIWLYSRSKATDETAESLRLAAEDALRWLVNRGIATSVKATATRTPGASEIAIDIKISRSTSSRWADAWAAFSLEPISGPGFLVTVGL